MMEKRSSATPSEEMGPTALDLSRGETVFMFLQFKDGSLRLKHEGA